MSPSPIDSAVVAAKTAIVEEMLRGLRSLPAGSLDEFLADPRNPALHHWRNHEGSNRPLGLQRAPLRQPVARGKRQPPHCQV